MNYDPSLTAPPEVVKAASTIREFAAKYTTGNDWQIFGLGPVHALQHQLDQVTRERDHYKAACALADALRNKERGYENK